LILKEIIIMKKAIFSRMAQFQRPSAKSLALVAVSLCAASAYAGVTGTEFKAFFDLIEGWTTGYLGKGLALSAFLLGAALGMVKGTMLPALVGVGFAIMFTVGPGVITGMLAATI
jgi:conjugal transfer pilus assembly protein TraA